MIKKAITITGTSSVESHRVAKLVQVASQFESKIFVESGPRKINVKSIMGMMLLGLDDNKEFVFSADGKDEDEAINSIEACLYEQ
jgi:catabolite repression HPr-like protein